MKFSESITAQHRSRKAIIYVRQSSPGQVKNNLESRELQLALKQRAIDFGWSQPSIEVIDGDLGLSGTIMVEREGMQYLIAQVAKNEVGIVWCWDISRMSRNCSDWFPFLDICAFRMVLIGDRDGIYDPMTPNGRCMLGIKGQFAELEMNAIRGRLTAGLLNKAKRGELVTNPPTGLSYDPLGRMQKDPDLSIQNAIQMIFDLFLKFGSAGKVLKFLLKHNLKMPRLNSKELVWKLPSLGAILSILGNPAYAGASVFGRTQAQVVDFQTKKRKRSRLSMDQWRYVVKDKFSGYINWEVFEQIQRLLHQNYSEYVKKETVGIPRNGKALATGLVYCAACGHKMRVQYDQEKNDARYVCNALMSQFGAPKCQNIPAEPVDKFVSAAFFEALSPIELNIFEEIAAEQKQQDTMVTKMKEQHLERLRYQAKLAERQFNSVDPDNRLVRVELEKRWETALKELLEAENEAKSTKDCSNPIMEISPEQREAFLDLGKKLPTIWHKLPEEKKKALLRAIVDKVVIYRREICTLSMRIVWKGGDTTSKEVWIPTNSYKALPSYPDLERRVVELAKDGKKDAEIAEMLSQEGYSPPRQEKFSPRVVKDIRRRAALAKRTIKDGQQLVPGFLTVSQVADKLQIARNWIYSKMRSGKLIVEKDGFSSAYLFPDTPEMLEKIMALKEGKIANLNIIGASR